MRAKAKIPPKKIRNQKIKQMRTKEEPDDYDPSTGRKLRLRDLEDYNSLSDDEKDDFWDTDKNFTD